MEKWRPTWLGLGVWVSLSDFTICDIVYRVLEIEILFENVLINILHICPITQWRPTLAGIKILLQSLDFSVYDMGYCVKIHLRNNKRNKKCLLFYLYSDVHLQFKIKHLKI